MPLHLAVLHETLAIAQLEPHAPMPAWAMSGSLFSITRTADELSIVCAAALVPADIQAARDWRALKVAGPLDFALTGILAMLAVPLGEAGISIFALSTYDTDYVLVRAPDLDRAVQVLRQAGHTVR